MAKKMQVNLTFTANIAQAQQQMKQLQNQLTQLSTGTNLGAGFNTLNQEMRESMQVAAQLKVHLQNATNVETGKLDLGKFNQQLKMSKMSIDSCATSLQKLGPQGQLAFLQLARSIQNAENPLMRVSAGMKKLGTTLANTARWTISSNILMGLTKSISTAYNYAQDLNKSLNNIRIVTGQTTSQMDAFAKKANAAAKALSTTTTAYTDAALIYYQQGLSDKEVSDRTDVTIKLANATGTNAQQVSEWMTAIWNNFYDGSKSLESFADKIAALGAATASSAEEIALGLEKFAAIGETVGLSYDYAVSALATVTAETRQSADVVGTAFKTLFARMQDLKLGNALEDGVTLGQYSEAMKAAGVNIKTVSGELKSMDVILNELGTTWEILDKGQQVALAKSVAGLRQYNQFIALMSNWDTMQGNLALAKSSEGELQEQQDIYAEGWEAAAKRVKAAAEEIYTSLFEDKFFIDLLGFFEKLLNGVNKFLDAAGGLPVLLGTIGSILMTKFSGNIADSISNISLSFMSLTKNGKKAAQDIKDTAWKKVQDMTKDTSAGMGQQARTQAAINEAKIQDQLNAKAHTMTKLEQQIYQSRLESLKTMEEERAKIGDQITEQTKLNEKMREAILIKSSKGAKESSASLSELGRLVTNADSLKGAASSLSIDAEPAEAKQKLKNVAQLSGKSAGVKASTINDFLSGSKNIVAVRKEMTLAGEDATKFEAVLYGVKKALQQLNAGKPVNALAGEFANLKISAEQLNESLLTKGIKATAKELKVSEKDLRAYVQGMRQATQSQEEFNNAGKNNDGTFKKLEEDLENGGNGAKSFGNMMLTAVGGLGQMLMAVNMLHSGFASLIDMFKEGEFSLSGLLSGLTSIFFAVTMGAKAWQTLTTAFDKDTLAKTLNTVATWINTRAQKANAESGKANKGDRNEETEIVNEDTKEKVADTVKQKVKVKKYKPKHAKKGSGKIKITKIKPKHAAGKGMAGAGKGAASTMGGAGGSVAGGAGGSTAGATTGSIASSLGTIAVPAAIIAAAIASVAVGLTIMNKQMNKHEEALKKANAEAKRMKEQYSKITEETEKFKSNLEEYNNSQKGLDGLVKGTLEYKEALLKANEQALELIKSSKRLQQSGAYTTQNGQIIINQKAMEEAQEEKLNYQANQLAITQAAEGQANQAKAEADKIEFAKKNMKSGSDTFSKESVGGYAGAAGAILIGGIANIWNPVGWIAIAVGIVGAATTAIWSAVEGTATEVEQDALEHLQKQYEDMPEMFASKENLRSALGPEFEHLTESLWKNKDKLEDLIQSNEALRLQNLALERQMADRIIESKYSDKVNEKASDAAATAVAAVTGSEEQEKVETNLFNEIKGQDGLLQDLYKEVHKQDGQTLTHMSGKKISIIDANGEYVGKEDDVSQEGVAREITQAVALAVRSGDDSELKKYKKIVDNSKGVNKKNKEQIKDYIDNLVAEEEIKQAIEEVNNQAAALDTLKSFEGNTNAVAYSQMLNALAEAKLEGDEANLGFLSREQMAELSANIGKFDAATQKAIKAAEKNYEIDKARMNLRASTEYNHEKTKADQEAKLVTRAGIDSGVLETYEDQLEDVYSLDDERAEHVAKVNLNAKAGVESLIEVFSKYDNILDKSKKGTLEYSQGITAIKKAYEEWFGVEITTENAEKEMETFKKAAEGDAEAIQKLQNLAADQIVLNFDLEDSKLKEVQGLIEEIRNSNMEIGATMDLNTEAAASKLANLYNSLIIAGMLSSEKAIQSLEALGFSVTTATSQLDMSFGDKFWENWEKGQGVFSSAFGAAFKNDDVTTIGSLTYQGTQKDNDTGMAGEAAAEKKKKNDDAKETLKEEKKRSYETKRWIDSLTNSYEKLNQAKDQAFGADKIALLEQEQNLLQRQIKAQKQLLNETKNYLAIDKEALNKYGVSFNSEGRVLNYTEIEEDYIRRLNAIGDSESDAYTKLKKEYDDFKAAIEKYDSTFDEVQQIELDITDKEIEKLQKKLEEIELRVELKVEVAEASKDAIDFQLEQLEDIPYETARKITLYQEKYTTGEEKYEAGKFGLNELMKNKGFTQEEIDAFWNGDDSKFAETDWTTDEMKQIKDNRELMKTGFDEAKESWKAMHEVIKTSFAEFNEEFDNAIDKMENWNSMLDHYGELVDLLGGENLGISDAQQLEILEAKINVIDGQIEAAKKKYDANVAFLEKAEAALAQAEKDLETDNSDAAKARVEYWKEIVLDAQNEVAESQTQLNELLMKGLEAASNKKQKEVDLALDDFLKSLTGYSSIEDWEEDRAWKDKQGSLYLDDYEKQYELSQLTRQVEESLSKTSLKNQEGLRKIQEAINKNKEKGIKMSKAEVDLLQKQLDIENAKIALEEAQNNKTKVQMIQDSEGNYGYMYTADAESINQAQSNLDKATYGFYQSTEEYMSSLDDMYFDATRAFLETIKEIESDLTLTQEERQKKMQEAQDKFLIMTGYTVEQTGILLGMSEDLYNDEYLAKNTSVGGMIQSGNDHLNNMVNVYLPGLKGHINTAKGYYGSLDQRVDDAIKNIEKYGNDYLNTWTPNFLAGLRAGIEGGGEGDSAKDIFDTLEELIGVPGGEDGTGGSGLYGRLSLADYQMREHMVKSFQNAGLDVKDTLLGGEGVSGLSSVIDEFINGKNGNDGVVAKIGELNTELGYVEDHMSTLGGMVDTLANWESTNVKRFENMAGAIKKVNDEYIELWENQERAANENNDNGKNINLNDADWQKVSGTWKVTSDEKKLKGYDTYNETATSNGSEFTMSWGFDKGDSSASVYKTTLDDGRVFYQVNGRWIDEDGFKNNFEKVEGRNRSDNTVVTPQGVVVPSEEVKPEVPKTVKTKVTKNLTGFVQESNGKKWYRIEDKWYSEDTIRDYSLEQGYSEPYESRDNGVWRFPDGANVATFSSEEDYNDLKEEGSSYPPNESSFATQKNVPLTSVVSARGSVTIPGGSRLTIRNSGKYIYYGQYAIPIGNIEHLLGGTQYKAFNTGGYTGAWGPEGRLAMLHQKEIVLNAHDTENFLTAINIVRSMVSQLENSAKLTSRNLFAAFASPKTVSNTKDQLEQNVTIHADFPNVTNRSEIEEAFGNLVNLAAQHINRNY